MNPRAVVLSAEFLDDLARIGDYIAERSGRRRAAACVDRVEDYCRGLAWGSERGGSRDDVLPGLRAVGFERSATILFVVEADAVYVLRVRARGVDWAKELKS